MTDLNEHAIAMLRAVLAMGLLSLVMFLWMYATRLPAFMRAGIDPQESMHPGSYHDRIPSSVRRVADNYNHLFEAPTIFYAVVLAIVVAGLADAVHAAAAWAFVGFRILHSLVQATINRVPLRFLLFVLSWVACAALIVRGAMQLF